jgi:hypothetical protein
MVVTALCPVFVLTIPHEIKQDRTSVYYARASVRLSLRLSRRSRAGHRSLHTPPSARVCLPVSCDRVLVVGISSVRLLNSCVSLNNIADALNRIFKAGWYGG